MRGNGAQLELQGFKALAGVGAEKVAQPFNDGAGAEKNPPVFAYKKELQLVIPAQGSNDAPVYFQQLVPPQRVKVGFAKRANIMAVVSVNNKTYNLLGLKAVKTPAQFAVALKPVFYGCFGLV